MVLILTCDNIECNRQLTPSEKGTIVDEKYLCSKCASKTTSKEITKSNLITIPEPGCTVYNEEQKQAFYKVYPFLITQCNWEWAKGDSAHLDYFRNPQDTSRVLVDMNTIPYQLYPIVKSKTGSWGDYISFNNILELKDKMIELGLI